MRARPTEGWEGVTVFTVGHSTRARRELLALLRSAGVSTLVDIRTIPRSRTNPQFDREELRRALPRAGMSYVHVPELGGLRKARRDSRNGAWRNASFRGYADHLATDEFRAGLEQLRLLPQPICLMCAEAVPWRCHRSIVADALHARGVVARHLLGIGQERQHVPPPFARFSGTRVTYPEAA